jgi:hypothetical protein
MQEKRELIVSRRLQKGSDFLDVIVFELSGRDISGSVFQFEEWFNNLERTDVRVTSGNRYAVRKAFVGRLMDLDEDGWKKFSACAVGSEDQRFFDPSGL